METQNLWPDFAIEKTRGPKAVLKEQAGYLMAKTNNVLSAEIRTQQYKGDLLHHFYVVAPALNNYSYELLFIKHKVENYYPVAVNAGQWEREITDEEEFVKLLGEVFNRQEKVEIISALLSQSLAD